jgi:serine/threonine protein kinase
VGCDGYEIIFDKDRFLGEGSYGEVWKIIRRKDGLKCAAKFLKLTEGMS